MPHQITVYVNPYIPPNAWVGFDADDNIVQLGALGHNEEFDGDLIVKIICGREFYRMLYEHVMSKRRLN
jgi:hypothetical protein